MSIATEGVSAKSIGLCNELLRGELSAIETYSSAIHKFDHVGFTDTLDVIRHRHIDSANALRKAIYDLGGEPDTASGAWGSFAKTLQSAANAFGEGSAVGVLERGEQYGISEYSSALEKSWLSLDLKGLIQSDLLPKLQENVILLADLRAKNK